MSPHYPLSLIRSLVLRGAYLITRQAITDTHALGLDQSDVLECIWELSEVDHYKTMPSMQFLNRMQDVYRPTFRGRRLYVKLQVARRGNDNAAIVVSFKER